MLGACGDGTGAVRVSQEAPVIDTETTLPPPTLPPEPDIPYPEEVTEDDLGGYKADPVKYLSGEQLADLQGATVPVMLPTWLPGWTRWAEPVVIVSQDHAFYQVSWHLPYLWSKRRHPLVDELDSTVTIRISGDQYQGELGGPESIRRHDYPFRHGRARAYRWNPENDRCHPDEVDGVGAALSWDVGEIDYIWVELSPGPACSNGRFAPEDMVRFADSVVSLSTVTRTG